MSEGVFWIAMILTIACLFIFGGRGGRRGRGSDRGYDDDGGGV